MLPAAAPAPLAAGYRALAGLLERSGPGTVETVEDAALAELPRDRAVFVLGWENRFFPAARDAATALGAVFGEGGIRLEQAPVARRGNAFVLAARHPADPALTLSWAALDDPAAAEGLGRKLPHYGKYGFLAFEGAEPANIAKGRWPATDSPLARSLGDGPAAGSREARAPRRRWRRCRRASPRSGCSRTCARSPTRRSAAAASAPRSWSAPPT